MDPSFNARALGLTLSVEETLRLASENGFRAVDLMVRDLVDQRADLGEVASRMEELGLRPGAFPFPFDWRGPFDRFQDDLASLSTIAEAASRLGLTRTGTWVLPEWTTRVEGDAESFHVSRLAPAASILGSFGIKMGLEVLGVASSRTGQGTPFVHRLDRLEPLRARIEQEAGVPVGVLVDSWHLYAAEEPISQALSWRAEQIVWVHVADLPAGAPTDPWCMVDAVRGLPGEHGAIASQGLLAALKSHGYEGPVTAEPLGRCRSLERHSPDEVARAAARSLRSIWPE